jgi:hypothetical protein
LWRLLRPSKKYCTGVERQRELIKRASRYAIGGPYFCNCWNVTPSAAASIGSGRFQPPQAQPRSYVAINGVRKTV